MRPTAPEWRSFSEIIGPSYEELRVNSDKPIWIAETGCTERGGDKAQWISEMFDAVLTTYPAAGLIWFNVPVPTQGQPLSDWPFDTSPEALAAFQEGVQRTEPSQVVPAPTDR